MLAFVFFVPVLLPDAHGLQPEEILERMRRSYAHVQDYQTHVLVRRYGEDGSEEVRRFTYTFKKPGMIRMDFQSPYAGLVLVYPGREGKALVRPFPWAPSLKMELALDSFLITGPSGQRIDQTGMGLLIENIGKSLLAERVEEPVIEESAEAVELHVLARDHFRREMSTRYTFQIRKTDWLPVAVDERTPEGSLTRQVRFRDLRTNLGISDRFFSLDD